MSGSFVYSTSVAGYMSLTRAAGVRTNEQPPQSPVGPGEVIESANCKLHWVLFVVVRRDCCRVAPGGARASIQTSASPLTKPFS